MESLNLNALATSLPTAQQKAEQELLNNFRAAALSITTLYRSSRQNAKRAYNAGYAAACQDLLTMIQQGVSVGGLGIAMPRSSASDDGGMTIGRVMDWTEARLEAIKAQEEEEDEEEEREKEKERTRSTSCAPPGHSKATRVSSNSSPPPSLPTPSSPVAVNSSNPPPEPTTPSPTLHQPSVPRPTQRSKPRTALNKGELLGSHNHIPTIPSSSVFNFVPDVVTPISPPISFPEMPSLPAVGTKRRHAMMMMLDAATPNTTGSNTPTQSSGVASSPASPASLSGPVRRRTRSNRGLQQNQNINNIMQGSNESMDIEDDARERKRVARR